MHVDILLPDSSNWEDADATQLLRTTADIRLLVSFAIKLLHLCTEVFLSQFVLDRISVLRSLVQAPALYAQHGDNLALPLMDQMNCLSFY